MLRVEVHRGRDHPRERRRLLLLAALATMTRLVYLFVATDPGAAPSDAGQYHELASNLAAGRGFSGTFPQLFLHPTAFRPPAYPTLLAIVYRITGPTVVAGKVANLVIGVTVVVLAARLVARAVNPTAGLIAGGLVAIYPPLIANDVNLLTEPMSLLLLVLLATELTGRARWWLIGLQTGMLVLTRPSAQLFVVIVGVYLLRRVGMRRTLAFAAAVALCVVPWVVRNHAQVGSWNLYTSNGFNVAAMYSPPAQNRHAFVDPVQDPQFDAYRFTQLDEGAWDGEMLHVGLDGFRSHPEYLTYNVGRNTAAVFELWPPLNEPAEREDGRNITVRLVALPMFYVVTALGVWGLVRARRVTAVSFLGASGAYFVAVSLVLVAPPRLRAPFDLACCVGAGIVLGSWWDRRTRAGVTPPVAVGEDLPTMIDQRVPVAPRAGGTSGPRSIS